MARTRRSTRTTSTSRSSRSGGGLARFLLPAAALGIGAYLLWPKRADAAVLPPPEPAPSPFPLPPPPVPSSAVTIEPVADAPLVEGTSRGRIVGGTDITVRNGPADNATIVSRLPQGAGVAIMIAPLAPPTPLAPQGRLLVRTARGKEGYVAAQYILADDARPARTAGWASNARVPGFYNYYDSGRGHY